MALAETQRVLKETLRFCVEDWRDGTHPAQDRQLYHEIDAAQVRRKNDHTPTLSQRLLQVIPAINLDHALHLLGGQPFHPEEVIVPLQDVGTGLPYERLDLGIICFGSNYMADVVFQDQSQAGRNRIEEGA
jgi:hypothetical protein